MIEIKNEKDKKLLHFICSGKVTHEDYQKVVIPIVEKKIRESGPLRAFCDLRDMKSIQLRAIWDDYKLGIRHLRDFDCLVTVGNQWWMGPLMKVSQPFFKIKLKHFKSHQYDEAWEWVKVKKEDLFISS